MSVGGPNPGWRRVRTTDPVNQGRLECAGMALDRGNTAVQLDVEQIDYLICDLIDIRHRRLLASRPNDAVRTVVADLGYEPIVLTSYFEDEFGPLEQR